MKKQNIPRPVLYKIIRVLFNRVWIYQRDAVGQSKAGTVAHLKSWYGDGEWVEGLEAILENKR